MRRNLMPITFGAKRVKINRKVSSLVGVLLALNKTTLPQSWVIMPMIIVGMDLGLVNTSCLKFKNSGH